MNRRHLLSAVAVALAVSAPAFADTDAPHVGDYGNTSSYTQHNGPRTRAEVRAEVEQARRDGTLAYLRKATSYPQGIELAQGPYRPTPEGNQLAGAGR
ncbi:MULTISPECIES: DUF4148 domain-containing protein [Burkholderia]|jgi:hypothetical protein|uniref:DUF4148 domain-containing protein n=1 Tax=Burkholderia multivorans CGD2 TaxID=513052 RepID=B9BUV6_9BURK|nr:MULTISPECIES: DUF4148 domain-containing protein [Burkholderia]EEE05603.1 conserved hypothetical protein [Burkholderia multivorans CGD2]EEE11876.1 conserved hypothetical protein [Burkholderia multivorans CGD2M]KVS18857.1 hypothetical protein WK33_01550 [Burkholderia multivorans]MBH9661786.1 DUF4148 domain-containing protein [Burkholderia multivorans]MBJ9684160.1 DUF4148 domain-containing protein [Burkholderia multivorans]